MSKRSYECYTGDEITKELLDSIKTGDLIKVNDWGKPLRVKGTSRDYFVMATKTFGSTDYSVCEKLQCEFTHNQMQEGKYHVGTDAWLFGCPQWYKHNEGGKYDFENEQATKDYLSTFELPDGHRERSCISRRSGVAIDKIEIKRK